MTFDPVFLSNLTLVLTAFGGAFLAALWISLVVWTNRDIRARARDPLVQTLATLLVAVLNLPGVLVYIILRPPRTLEEEYQRTLTQVLKVARAQTLIEDNPPLALSLSRRNPYLDPLNAIQVTLLDRYRKETPEELERNNWLDPLLRSINAIAAGMRNTG